MKFNNVFIFILFVLVGCATTYNNAFTSYYKSVVSQEELIENFDNSESDLQVYKADDVQKDISKIIKRGYNIIGESSFIGETDASLVRVTATAIGANVVLLSVKYRNTESGTNTIYLPSFDNTPRKKYDVSYNKDKYEYRALFFKKMKPLTLGITMVPIPAEITTLIKRNRGVMVQIVFDESPAFFADLVVGDVIIAINDKEINNVDELNRLILLNKGQKTQFTIIRSGQTTPEDIFINLNDWK